MKKIATYFGLFAVGFTLSGQSISANFEVDEQGWTSHFTGYLADDEEGCEWSIEWSKLIAPFADRGGLSFFGKNCADQLFLYVQKEIDGLLPNTNYRVIFNMDWLSRMEPEAPPIFIKIGATSEEPKQTETGLIEASFRKGEIGRDGRDLKVVGSLTPNSFGYTQQQNLQNFDNAFLVNTDDLGRLFLMIGVEPESGDVENIFLNTLRILLIQNGEAQEISNINPSSVVFYPNMTNDVIFFESDYNSEIEMVNIYTKDHHLIKVHTFRDPFADRAFRTIDLTPGTYRIEFVLHDGRTINKSYTVE